jgi:DNA (cytosine-5)-methyltransferase 1
MGVYTSVEICAGAGGQALGLEQAGFKHLACIELDPHACETLRLNRQDRWNVVEHDVRTWKPTAECFGVSLLAGGVPCPPFSLAGKQLGRYDERDLFPAMLDLVDKLDPRAVMIENVRGLLGRRFDDYRRNHVEIRLKKRGYEFDWALLQASDFGVPQLRPRTVLVAMRPEDWKNFEWPTGNPERLSVGDVLRESMKAGGWERADEWADHARGVAPTLVGGSKKHGGADLGPTRAKREWRERFCVDALGVADDVPRPGFDGMPKLTVQQAALLQGFPPDWRFAGRKTAVYRQVGNAFPPPAARAVGESIRRVFVAADNMTREAAVA